MSFRSILAVLAAFMMTEFTDVSPWLATKLVRWSAAQAFPDDPEQAKDRAEELEAHISAIPGKLSKLGFGLSFGYAGLREWVGRGWHASPSWLQSALKIVFVVVMGSVLAPTTLITFRLEALHTAVYVIWLANEPPLIAAAVSAMTVSVLAMAGFGIHKKISAMRGAGTSSKPTA
jgi:hypothetical protein